MPPSDHLEHSKAPHEAKTPHGEGKREFVRPQENHWQPHEVGQQEEDCGEDEGEDKALQREQPSGRHDGGKGLGLGKGRQGGRQTHHHERKDSYKDHGHSVTAKVRYAAG